MAIPEAIAGLERLVRAGEYTEAAAALARASNIEARLRPAALAATVIASRGVQFGSHIARQPFVRLLRSGAVAAALGDLSGGTASRIRQAMRGGGQGGLISEEEALAGLASGFVEWKAPSLQQLFEPVVAAGGLGPVALALEHRFGGIDREDYRGARAELARLERGLGALMTRPAREVFPDVPARSFGTNAAFRRRGRFGKTKWQSARVITALAVYLGQNFPDTLFEPNRMPRLWTDFLLKREGAEPGKGYCSPAHGTFAHLALLAGKDVRPLLHFAHLNAFDPVTGLAFDVLPLPFFSTPEEWRKVHLLGPGEGPGPVYGFLASVAGNLAGVAQRGGGIDLAVALRRAAVEVHPDWSQTHLALSYTARVPAEALLHGRRAVELNPDNPETHASMAYAFAKEGGYDEAYREILEAERLIAAAHGVQTPVGPLPRFFEGLDPDHLKAVILQLGGRFTEAVPLFRTVLARNPRHLEAMRGLAKTLERLSHSATDEVALELLGEAMRLLERLVAEAPADFDGLAQACYNLGVLYLRLGRPQEEALAQWERAVAMQPALRDALRRQVALSREGTPEERDLAEQIIVRILGES